MRVQKVSDAEEAAGTAVRLQGQGRTAVAPVLPTPLYSH